VTWSQDEASVVTGLHEALRKSGLTQAGLARALGTSASRLSTYLSGSTAPSATFYLRASRLAHGLELADRLRRMTPTSTAAAMRAALGEGDEGWAMRTVMQGRDDLRAMLAEGSAGADAWECDPGLLGRPAWDALLSALVAHEFAMANRGEPRWTRGGARTGTWVFTSPYYDEDEVRRRTPGWLADRGVYLVARDLATA